ncbi:Lanosterol synthase (Oxidosqualene--lanosterol cyclase) [Kappamyces sp. JEL0829]|nr:Lanosterol synthase (Oxidosqualene--lanosterol cyclase) [Kappamyces sp. JEL0829]
MTDLRNWRLKVDSVGRQTWHFLQTQEEQEAWPQSRIDQYWLGLLQDPTVLPKPRNALESARNGLRFYEQLQTESGHFAGEYGGPMFLIPGLVIVMYITKTPFPPGYAEELIRYLRNRANKDDGGWGIHIEGQSTVFGTSLNYVALRLLGVSALDPVCTKARNTLWNLGGSTGIPAWGKFWLSVLNVYDWEGSESIPPELWLLPYVLPIHPGRMWCHTRAVYLPMCYLYGIRYAAPLDDLTSALREELYPMSYDEIDWPSQRSNVAPVDLYSPTSSVMGFLNGVLSVYEKLPNAFIRKMALQEALKQIRMEDENTDFLDIGPVNKVMQMLVIWIVDGPESKTFAKHVARVPDFMWVSSEGMMMNGTNGSQLWDTAFAVQAVLAGPLQNEPRFHPFLNKSLEFLDNAQIRENVPNQAISFRHTRKGAWPFSTKEQGYTVSDCTAEALKTVLLLQNGPWISDDRMFDAVNVLLSLQNGDGGVASYELQRGPTWLELLNPAQVFGNIMIEYCYPECTTAVLLGLSAFRKQYPNHRADEIERFSKRAIQYIKTSQLPDGSWYGSWGICFTYATFFAVESLASVGETFDTRYAAAANPSESLRRACEFLESKQMSDGSAARG